MASALDCCCISCWRHVITCTCSLVTLAPSLMLCRMRSPAVCADWPLSAPPEDCAAPPPPPIACPAESPADAALSPAVCPADCALSPVARPADAALLPAASAASPAFWPADSALLAAVSAAWPTLPAALSPPDCSESAPLSAASAAASPASSALSAAVSATFFAVSPACLPADFACEWRMISVDDCWWLASHHVLQNRCCGGCQGAGTAVWLCLLQRHEWGKCSIAPAFGQSSSNLQPPGRPPSSCRPPFPPPAQRCCLPGRQPPSPVWPYAISGLDKQDQGLG